MRVNYTGARHFGRKVIAVLMLLEVGINALWIAEVLPSIAVRDAMTWALILVRGVLTALEFTAATNLWQGSAAASALARRVLAASAALMLLETGFRLAPTNLDPTFKWWVTGAYWVYMLAAGWVLRPASLNHEGHEDSRRASP